MAANNRNGRERYQQRPFYVLEDPSTTSPTHPVNFLGIPLTGLDTTIQVDHEEAARAEEEHYGDKVLVSFENNYFMLENVPSWLEAFNAKEVISLSLDEPLINSLFVVQVNALDIPTAIGQLIERFLICIDEICASFNHYGPNFDPEDPYQSNPEFKQLVTVVIKKGSRLIYKYIKCI